MSPSAGLRVGEDYDLVSSYTASYNCSGVFPTAADSTVCGQSVQIVPVRAETLAASLRLERYTADQTCDFQQGCRNAETGVFGATVAGSLRVCQVPAGGGTLTCQSLPLDPQAGVRLNLTTCPGFSVCADRTGRTFWVAVVLGIGDSYTLWGLQDATGASGTLVAVERLLPVSADPRTITVAAWSLTAR
jgi:hypothetical protein